MRHDIIWIGFFTHQILDWRTFNGIDYFGLHGRLPTKDVGTTAYLLTSDDFRLLIDVGSNALLSLEHHLDPLDLDALILTHYHADHIADLGVLQYTFQLKEPAEGKSKKILPIYGHTESEFFRLLEMTGVSEGIAYAPDETLELGPFRIHFLKTIHPVPCYALRIEEIATGKGLRIRGGFSLSSGICAFCEGC